MLCQVCSIANTMPDLPPGKLGAEGAALIMLVDVNVHGEAATVEGLCERHKKQFESMAFGARELARARSGRT